MCMHVYILVYKIYVFAYLLIFGSPVKAEIFHPREDLSLMIPDLWNLETNQALKTVFAALLSTEYSSANTNQDRTLKYLYLLNVIFSTLFKRYCGIKNFIICNIV